MIRPMINVFLYLQNVPIQKPKEYNH
uniref:Uncharacterized protein n=1 Tax=Anguilla anguilla TaxID=7936 RepID=A0A0E9XWQ9_ANGAN